MTNLQYNPPSTSMASVLVSTVGVGITFMALVIRWATTQPAMRSRVVFPEGVRKRYALDAFSISGVRAGALSSRLIVSKSAAIWKYRQHFPGNLEQCNIPLYRSYQTHQQEQR